MNDFKRLSPEPICSESAQPFTKAQKRHLFLPLSIIGAGYFLLFSPLQAHPLLEMQLFLLPVQLGFAAYFLVWKHQARDGAYKHETR